VLLRVRLPEEAKESSQTEEHKSVRRKTFLKGAGAVVVLVAAGGVPTRASSARVRDRRTSRGRTGAGMKEHAEDDLSAVAEVYHQRVNVRPAQV
jgi:hypothetical protein